MRPSVTSVTLVAAILLSGSSMRAQSTPERAPLVFARSTDIGKTLRGSTEFGPAPGEFRITGGGADMWGTEDAFRFNWVTLAGDATLTAEVHFPAGTVPLAKAVLIFRQSLQPSSAYADIAIHGDGHVTLQFRSTTGAETRDVTAQERGATTIRIERKGDLFTTSTKSADGTWKVFASENVALTGPVYVGLGVCSHNPDGVVTATFTHVELQHAAHVLPVAH